MSKSIIATFTAAVAVAAALLLTGCERAIDMAGRPVSFAAGISDAGPFSRSGQPQTRVSYGRYASDSTSQALDWQEGDHITIYCEACEDKKIAMYEVQDIEKASADDMHSYAGLVNAESDGAGLRWGTGEHTFYAVYPSPEEDRSITIGIGPYSDGGTRSSVAKSISNNIVTAAIPSRQKVIGSVTESDGIWTATPDLTNMLMTAKSTYSAETGIPDGSVFLDFKPLTTVLEFTIKKEDSDSVMDISSVSLTSAAHALSGRFKVDMDVNGKYTTTGTSWCTEGSGRPETTLASATPSEADRKVTINFGSPVKLAKEQSLTFTFFLNPGNDVDDLTFSISGTVGKESEEKESFNRKTALKKSDGTGVPFPTHQKTRLTGLMLPDAIGWTVNYAPTVQSWNQSSTGIDPMPETGGDPFVTSWDAGVNEPLELKEPDYLPGIFTISAGADEIAGTDDDVKVRFSKGNLIATVDATGTPTNWRFATNQYDCLGEGGANQTIGTTAGDVDIFWWSVPDTNYGINGRSYDNPFIDWGNTMDNKGTWCTLSTTEWRYLFSFSVQANDIRAGLYSYGVTVVGHTNCCILYPDGYSGTKVSNGDTTSYDTAEEWSVAEKEGVVCLPAGGIRRGSIVSQMGTEGYYWSSSYAGVESAYDIYFSSERIQAAWYGDYLPSTCCSVRLVTDAN